MKQTIYFDTLTVSKGPEDGMSFSITSTPVFVGRDPSCLVNLQFDVTIQPEHARLAVGSGGYRVRRLTGAAVTVNGARAGRILSRTLKNGQVLRVGYTELVLNCAPDGHAATNAAPFTESDAVWAIRAALRACGHIALFGLDQAKKAARTAAVHWFWSLLALAGIAFFLIEPLREATIEFLTKLRK